ncbi:MAG: OmpA family protein [Gammaproteobacteria bacterium]
MKTVFNVVRVVAVTLLALSNALAEEKDFGTVIPSEAEIIQHFKESTATDEPALTDEYQDVSESDLKNVRGLKKINTLEKIAAKKPKIRDELSEKAISLQILFDYDSAELTPTAKAQLKPIGNALASGELKGLKFKIEGHTDIIGSNDYNIDLSRRRALAVEQHLIDEYGIAPSALEIEGKGETGLADASNPTSEVNRRVRIVGLGKN